MPHLYTFTQYNTPGPGQAGGPLSVWRFTSDVEPFTDTEGSTYEPAILAHDAIDVSQERSAGQVYLRSTRDFAIAQLFRAGTPARPIWLEVRNPDTGDLAYKGRVRNCVWGEAEAKLLLSSVADLLQREGLRIRWQGPCQWALYSAKCGVDADATGAGGAYLWRNEGTVASVSSDGLTIISPDFATRADGFFNAGKLEALGQVRMITSHTGSAVKLLAPIPGLEPGAAFKAYKGCNRSSGTGGCGDFGNTANFGGCPNVKRKNVFVSGLET